MHVDQTQLRESLVGLHLLLFLQGTSCDGGLPQGRCQIPYLIIAAVSRACGVRVKWVGRSVAVLFGDPLLNLQVDFTVDSGCWDQVQQLVGRLHSLCV